MIMQRTDVKHGIFVFLMIGLFFLIIDALGLSHIDYLKLVNIIFVFIGVNWTLKNYAKKGGNYLRLFSAGLVTALVGVGLSILGLFIYLEWILSSYNLADYSNTMIPSTTLSQYILALFAEGLSSSIIIVFGLLQYWKNRQNLTKPIS